MFIHALYILLIYVYSNAKKIKNKLSFSIIQLNLVIATPMGTDLIKYLEIQLFFM